uniref:Uncharacterized protein n=1 Tax=Rousettus aegyptiacus TaxID=9407 RepID=A0A7J8DXN0_ROUAE|nr:hypothetical protein HJG63_008419 [Rousettus aegyptiacus]
MPLLGDASQGSLAEVRVRVPHGRGPQPPGHGLDSPRACRDPGRTAGERSFVCVCSCSQRRRHRLSSASAPQAIDAHGSPGPWCHTGWGPLPHRKRPSPPRPVLSSAPRTFVTCHLQVTVNTADDILWTNHPPEHRPHGPGVGESLSAPRPPGKSHGASPAGSLQRSAGKGQRMIVLGFKALNIVSSRCILLCSFLTRF